METVVRLFLQQICLTNWGSTNNRNVVAKQRGYKIRGQRGAIQMHSYENVLLIWCEQVLHHSSFFASQLFSTTALVSHLRCDPNQCDHAVFLDRNSDSILDYLHGLQNCTFS